jgi:hypothetical protein
MTAFLQGISQFLPEIQPYQPDLNFFGNMLQTKQYQYDQGYNQVNNLYASLLNAPVLRQESSQRRDEFFKKIQSGIQKVSTLDLSLEQNVNAAAKIFQPLIDDEDINYDMMRTGQYQQELAKAERLKNCIDPKDCGGEEYWEGGVRALNYWAQDFSKASADQARQYGKPTYTSYVNVAKNAMNDLKKMGFEDVEKVSFSSDGKWIVKTKGGAPIVSPLYNYLLQSYGSDPKVQELMRTQAYLKRKDYVAQNSGSGDPQQAELAYLNDMTTQLNDFARQQKLQAESNRDQLTAANTVVKDAIDKGIFINPEDELNKALGLNDEQIAVENNAAKYHNETLSITDPEVLDVNNISALRNKIDAAVSRDILSKTLYDTSVAFASAYESVDLEVNPYAKSAYDAALDRSKMMLQSQLDAAKMQLDFGMDIAKENLRAQNDMKLAIAKGEVKGNNGVNGADPNDPTGPLTPEGGTDGNLMDITAGGESDWRYSQQLLAEDAINDAGNPQAQSQKIINDTQKLMFTIAKGDNPSQSLVAKSVLADMLGITNDAKGDWKTRFINTPGSQLEDYYRYKLPSWQKMGSRTNGEKGIKQIQNALGNPAAASLLKANRMGRGDENDVYAQLSALVIPVVNQQQMVKDLADNNLRVSDKAYNITAASTGTISNDRRLTDEYGSQLIQSWLQNPTYLKLSPEKKQESINKWWDLYKEKQKQEQDSPAFANTNITNPDGEIIRKYMRFDQATNRYVVDHKSTGVKQKDVLLESQAIVNEEYRKLRKDYTDLNLDTWSASTNAGDLWDKAVTKGREYYRDKMFSLEFDDKVIEYASNYYDATNKRSGAIGFSLSNPFKGEAQPIYNKDGTPISKETIDAWKKRSPWGGGMIQWYQESSTHDEFFRLYTQQYQKAYNTMTDLKQIFPGMDTQKKGGGAMGIPYYSHSDAANYAGPGMAHVRDAYRNYQEAVAVDPKGVKILPGKLSSYETISDMLAKDNSTIGADALKHFIEDINDFDSKWTSKDLQRPRGGMTTRLVTLGNKDYVSFEFSLNGGYIASRTQSGEAGKNLTEEEQAAIAATSKKDDEIYTVIMPASQANTQLIKELRKGDQLGNYVRGGNTYEVDYNNPMQGTYAGKITFSPVPNSTNILVSGAYNAYDPSQGKIVPHTNIYREIGVGENLTLIRDTTEKTLSQLNRVIINDYRSNPPRKK